MQRWWLAAVALLLAACGGSKGLCGGQTCAAGQRCDNTNAVCVFNEAPKLTLTSPADQSQVTVNPLPFAGTAWDDEGVPKVEWSVDGTTWTEVAVADHAFSGDAALPALDGRPVSFTVRATDKAGQVTTVVAGLSVDDVSPPCEQLSPMPLEVFKTGMVDVRFKASGYTTLDLTLDEKAITPAVAGDELSYSWPVPTEDWVTHKLHLIATDAAGNTCELKSGFVVDNVPPMITLEQPTDGQVMGPDTFGLEFAFGQSTDGSLVTNTVVDVDDGVGFVQSGIWADHWVVGRDLPAGEDFVQHTLKIKATDLAGNVTELDTHWVADVVPPRLTIVSPSPGQKLNASNVDGNGDVTVSWTVADGDPLLAVVSPQAMGQTFSPPVISFGLPTASTDNGAPYMVELTAVTRTGSTTGTVGFTVDRIPPFIVSSSTPPGSRSATLPVTVQFNEPTNKFPISYGTWSSDGMTLTVAPPNVRDQVFAISDYQVADLSGNYVVMPPDFHVRTAPAVWDGGVSDAGLVDVPGATALSASSDFESVLSFATLTGSAVTWYRVNTHSGAVEQLDTFAYALTQVEFQTNSSLPANASATEPRLISGSRSGTSNPYYLFDGHSLIDDVVGLMPEWQIINPLVPGECCVERTGHLLHGFPGVQPTIYVRDSIQFGLPFYKVGAVGIGGSHWAVIEAGATGQWADFGCDAGTCGFIQAGQFADAVGSGTHSVASTTRCDLHAFASSNFDGGYGLATVQWTAGCPAAGCTNTAAVPVTGDNAALAADPVHDSVFELLTNTGSTFSISTGTLDANCTPTLTPVSSFTVQEGLIDAKPVWMYGKPSALYLDSNGAVRLYVSP